MKGKENKVADFLSRIDANRYEIYALERNDSELASIHSSIENLGDHIPISDKIINKYLTQIHLVKEKEKEIIIKYKTFRQIYISENEVGNDNYLNDVLRRYIKKGVTGIFSELEDRLYNLLQQKLIELFSNEKRIKFLNLKL